MSGAADTGAAPRRRRRCRAGQHSRRSRQAASTKGLYFVRRVTAMQDFEVFFVSSVATILLVRAILAATGWPQLGGGKIHFAHLLWGGIGMLLAFILFMAMQGRLWDFLATLSAGIGFGLFLDELGKFITSDNDYFFRPAVAIMYVLFVVLFFLFRWLGRVDRMGPETALVNSFDFAKEAVMRSMNEGERDEALYVLGRADPADSMVRALTTVLGGVHPPAASANAAARAWERLPRLVPAADREALVPALRRRLVHRDVRAVDPRALRPRRDPGTAQPHGHGRRARQHADRRAGRSSASCAGGPPS